MMQGQINPVAILVMKEIGIDVSEQKSKIVTEDVIRNAQLRKCKDVLPLTEEIVVLQIGVAELIALKAGINQAVKQYSSPPLAATLRLIEDIRKIERLGGLERELQRLLLQKFATTEACARQSLALAKMQNQSNIH